MADNDTSDSDLQALAAAASERDDLAGRPRRRRVPSPRVLAAGGLVLRLSGAVLLILGTLPLYGAVVALLHGGGANENLSPFKVFGIELRIYGWVAGFMTAAFYWLYATVVFAFGHALYAIRDMVAANRIDRGARA